MSGGRGGGRAPGQRSTHLLVLPVADLGEVQPRHHAEARGQPLQEQPHHRRQQQHPQQLGREEGSSGCLGAAGSLHPAPAC